MTDPIHNGNGGYSSAPVSPGNGNVNVNANGGGHARQQMAETTPEQQV